MPITLDATQPDFETRFTALLSAKREESADVDDTVAAIIADVRARGDAAVIELTARFDRVTLTPETLRVSGAEIDALVAQVPPEEREALELAADRIRAYHARQIPPDESWTDDSGAMLGWRWGPVSAAGLYVPGGLASYPSSVLMNAIPAKVAGVARLAITVPTPGGVANPLVLLAARIAGVDEVYRVGGAQAIAALAYGTETIAPVDKITGPGNAFVAAAKRRVFGRVGIDMIAGPSEILVIADTGQNPDWIALDMLSQAEHDESAQAILITDDAGLARDVATAIEARLETLEAPRHRGRKLARFRRDHHRAGSGHRRCPQQSHRPRTPGAVRRRPRGVERADHPCRRDLPGRVDARGDRRLRGRAEPRPAHGALGAVLKRPVGDGFPQAHDAGEDDPRGARGHRPRRRNAGPRREPRGPRPFGARAARSSQPLIGGDPPPIRRQ